MILQDSLIEMRYRAPADCNGGEAGLRHPFLRKFSLLHGSMHACIHVNVLSTLSSHFKLALMNSAHVPPLVSRCKYSVVLIEYDMRIEKKGEPEADESAINRWSIRFR